MNEFKLKWRNKEIVIGKGRQVLVNQLVGINKAGEYSECLSKIDMWDKNNSGPDIITDVSTNCDDVESIWKYVLSKGEYIVGTVPIYFLKDKTNIRKEDLISIINEQLSKGVKIITIHPTPSYELIKLSKDRIVPFTSRGGGIIIKDMIMNKRHENVYMECLDEIISICIKYNAAISIGTSFRAANIFDSMDATQRAEIRKQYELANYIEDKGANVIIEMPGHAPPHKIEMLNELIINEKYPIMPLGPIVTDIGTGMDHITAAIGLTLMGLKGNVQIISAVTSEEHTGKIPSKESTFEAIKTAKLVAHIIDIGKNHDYTKDYECAKKRKESCNLNESGAGCSRCNEYCPLLVSRLIEDIN